MSMQHGNRNLLSVLPSLLDVRSRFVYGAEDVTYGSPDEIALQIEALREVGAGYVLLNGGGSDGGARGRDSLRRFARDIMSHFAAAAATVAV